MNPWAAVNPGVTATRTFTPRILFKQRSQEFLAGGKLIDGDQSRDPGNSPDITVLRPGLLMGKITASGLYAPAYVGALSAAYTSGGTELTVSAAVATELARLLGQSGTAEMAAVGPPTANGTLATTNITHSAINTTTGAITITDLGVDKVAGTLIALTDGRGTPLTMISDWNNGSGIKVVDMDGTDLATVEMPLLPIEGVITSSQLLPVWPSDTSIRAHIVTALTTAGMGHWTFDHLYG